MLSVRVSASPRACSVDDSTAVVREFASRTKARRSSGENSVSLRRTSTGCSKPSIGKPSATRKSRYRCAAAPSSASTRLSAMVRALPLSTIPSGDMIGAPSVTVGERATSSGLRPDAISLICCCEASRDRSRGSSSAGNAGLTVRSSLFEVMRSRASTISSWTSISLPAGVSAVAVSTGWLAIGSGAAISKGCDGSNVVGASTGVSGGAWRGTAAGDGAAGSTAGGAAGASAGATFSITTSSVGPSKTSPSSNTMRAPATSPPSVSSANCSTNLPVFTSPSGKVTRTSGKASGAWPTMVRAAWVSGVSAGCGSGAAGASGVGCGSGCAGCARGGSGAAAAGSAASTGASGWRCDGTRPPRRLPGRTDMKVSTRPPTPAPSAPASGARSRSPCSGSKVSRAMRFCMTSCANSCPPSATSPVNTRWRYATNFPRCFFGTRRRNTCTGMISVAPGMRPSTDASRRCFSVAPPALARSDASPAPARVNRAPAPTGPVNAETRTPATTVPTPPPNRRPGLSSKPGSAGNNPAPNSVTASPARMIGTSSSGRKGFRASTTRSENAAASSGSISPLRTASAVRCNSSVISPGTRSPTESRRLSLPKSSLLRSRAPLTSSSSSSVRF